MKWCFRPPLCTLFRLNWAKQTPGNNEAKLITKLAPEWVRTSDPVIRSPARYRWATAPANYPLYPTLLLDLRPDARYTFAPFGVASVLGLVCWSLTSLCHSNGHIETRMPARESQCTRLKCPG